MSVDVKNLCRVAGASAAVTTALQAATAVVAVRRGRRDYADGVWGPGLAAIALIGAAIGSGDRWRRWTLAAATAAWATRLERQMIGRLRHSDEEDSRYTEFLDGDSTAMVVAKVFVSSSWRGPVSGIRSQAVPAGGPRVSAPGPRRALQAEIVGLSSGLADVQSSASDDHGRTAAGTTTLLARAMGEIFGMHNVSRDHVYRLLRTRELHSMKIGSCAGSLVSGLRTSRPGRYVVGVGGSHGGGAVAAGWHCSAAWSR